MSDLHALAIQYQSALEEYLAGVREPALQQAYELGRQALDEGLGIIDVVSVHSEALARAVRQTRLPEEGAQVAKRAMDFFLESVSAFEMIDRGYREANVTLHRVNTELEAANKELARDADQYATMLATTPDGFWRFDADGRLLEVNDLYCGMSGYSRDELLSFHIPDIEVIEKPEDVARRICKVMETGFDRFESQHRRKDGGILDVEISVSYCRATGQFLLFARDISKRKHAEEALRESERKFRLLAETIEDVFWMSTPGVTRMLYISPAYEKLWEKSVASLYQAPQSFLERIHPDDLSTLNVVMQQYHARGKSYQCEYRIVQPDGSVRWIFERGFPIYDDAGNVKYMTGTCTDITERKRAEEQIRQLNAELEQRVAERTAQLAAANRELEAFSYSISHDLRTPLASIDGFAQLLIQDYGTELKPEALNYARLIHASAQEMQKLVMSLLEFSRSSRLPLNRQSVAPTELARQVLDELLSQQMGRQVEIVMGQLPPCQADPILLKQVFANLLSNALKFTQGREPARIEIGACSEGGQTAYFVRDNGVGFDVERADKLFGVFQRLHAAEDFEGNGVGLAIVARIVHRHGGRVWAEAHVDQGATFYFTI